MRRLVLYFIFLILMMACAMTSADEQPYRLSILESSEREIICDVYFDSIAVTQRQVQSVWQTSVTLAGCTYTSRQDWPKLPVTALVLGIPSQGSPQLQVVQEQVVSKSVTAMEMVRYPEAWQDQLPLEERSQLSDQREIAWYPAEVVRAGLCGMMRDQRILQIEMHPARYSASQNLLQLTQSLRLRITFDGTAEPIFSPFTANASLSREEYESVYRGYLANYEQSRKWRSAAAPVLAKASEEAAEIRFRIAVSQDGVYAITGRELKEAGADLASVDARTIRLTHRGREIPILLEDHGDGRMDDEDRLLFIGEHNRGATTYRSWYSDTNIYWLSWGHQAGSRMAQVSGALTGAVGDTIQYAAMHLHLEPDLQYERQLAYMVENADHWFWRELKDKTNYSFPITIPEPAPNSKFKITVEMQGMTYLAVAPDHKAQISLNQQTLGTVTWDNQEFVLFDSDWQDADILNRENNLSIYLPGDLANVAYDRVMLNWIHCEFSARLQAVKDSLRFTLKSPNRCPIRVENFSSNRLYVLTEQGRHILPDRVVPRQGGYQVLFSCQTINDEDFYLVAENRLARVQSITKDTGSQLTKQSNGADYLIITHSDFLVQAERLGQYRAAQGLRTMVVDVQDIYDEFNDGIYDPNAIQAFLRYAYVNYVKPAPLYVLLIGDTSHYMDKQIASQYKYKSYVPTMMTYTNSWGMTSSDNAFVAIRGSDILPDMYIGRFPANTKEEAEILVSKTIAYETQYVLSEWRRNMILVTGNSEEFETDADELAKAFIPRNMVINRLATLSNSRFFGSTQDLAEKWNEGQVVINFVGHGGGQVFEDSRLFLLEDVSRLKNKNKYSVMFSLTCFIGYFDNPERPSLSEELLRQADLGIVAHFGSAGRASMLGDHYLNKALFETIFDQGRRRLGEITTLAKFGLIQKTNGYWDTIRHFNLLGDPALRLCLAENKAAVSTTKTDYQDGDTLQVSVTAKELASGQAIVSVYNDVDSLIIAQQINLQQGKLSSQPLTFSPEIVRAWKNKNGEGSVKVYIQNGQKDESGGAAFTLNRQAIAMVQTLPSMPKHAEPFYFIAQVDAKAMQAIGGVQQGLIRWSINQSTWNSLPVVQEQSGRWRTTTTLNSTEGTRIYYRLVLTGTTGKQLTSELANVSIQSRPDLYSEVNSLSLSGVNQTLISVVLKNIGGTAAGPFSVAFYEGTEQATAKGIASPVRLLGMKAKSDTTITMVWPGVVSGQHRVWVKTDVQSEVDETNESNNITVAMLRIVNPTIGTNGPLVSDESNMFVDIPAGSISQTTTLILGNKWNQSFAASSELAGLKPMRLRDLTNARAFFYTLADSALALKKEMTVAVFFALTDTANQRYLRENGVRLYAWNETSATWSGLATTIDRAQGFAAAKLPVTSKYFSLMASLDRNGPNIEVGVVGQNFAPGDIVSKRPVFTIFLQDSSGLDLAGKPVSLYLDQQPVSENEITTTQNPDVRRSLSLTYTPELAAGDHLLTIEARDLNGNLAHQEIACQVIGQFEVTSLANHPNPFSRETTVAFFLQDTASEVELAFFTVSGRLIRSQKLYGVTGYVEWDWDGQDDDGHDLANGVYYLKFTARNGDKKIERIEKLAKLQ